MESPAERSRQITELGNHQPHEVNKDKCLTLHLGQETLALSTEWGVTGWRATLLLVILEGPFELRILYDSSKKALHEENIELLMFAALEDGRGIGMQILRLQT